MRKTHKDRLRLWVKALRTTKHKQARGCLRSTKTDGRCCLGIACDVYHEQTGKGKWVKDTEFGWGFEGSEDTLPQQVRKWYGLEFSDPLICLDESAAVANDEKRWRFKKIADKIETFYRLAKKKGGKR